MQHQFKQCSQTELEHIATCLAESLQEGLLIYFTGSLGAGKTTFIRALLRHLGVTGPIKSPSYALVEPYQCRGFTVLHYDLYRLADPEELSFLGWREAFASEAICLVEWPLKAEGLLPKANLHITLSGQDDFRHIELQAGDDKGATIIAQLIEDARK